MLASGVALHCAGSRSSRTLRHAAAAHLDVGGGVNHHHLVVAAQAQLHVAGGNANGLLQPLLDHGGAVTFRHVNLRSAVRVRSASGMPGPKRGRRLRSATHRDGLGGVARRDQLNARHHTAVQPQRGLQHGVVAQLQLADRLRVIQLVAGVREAHLFLQAAGDA